MIIRSFVVTAVATVLLSTAGCELDLNDPNTPTEEEVISSAATIAQIAVGLQAEYSNQFDAPVYVTGMITNELGANTATFEYLRVLDTGLVSGTGPGPGEATNDVGASTATWSGMYRVIREADVLIANASNAGFGPGITSGILALARLYKAMALGNLIQVYERIPLEVGPTIRTPEFADRESAFDAIITLLQDAAAQLEQTPTSAEFRTQILAPGFDLENTIQAMLARYALISGDLTLANDAAGRVAPTVFSEFRFSANDANPLWNIAVNGGNSTSMRPKDQWRLDAEANDQRIDYWVAPAELTGFAVPLDNFNRYSDRTHSFPAYLPDEMKLIRAEVAARNNDLPVALQLVNEVRTQCTSALPEPVACLPALLLVQVPSQAAMLAEILKQRRYELYLQGLRWSDLRRFGLPVKFAWMPVPITECDRNENTPAELCDEQPANPAAAS
jgi:starch-binding outer membrane protein, SusD/RagB family